MPNVSITDFKHAELSEILEADETVLWTGHPMSGRKFFQPVGSERTWLIGFVIGALVMFAVLPFIEDKPNLGRQDAIYVFSAAMVGFAAAALVMASERQFVLRNLAYFVTNKRAIVFRRGRNWRFANRLFVISCAHHPRYPYRVIRSKPYPSLQVGTLISEDEFQPLGFGLSHPGQPIFWNRNTAPVVFEYIEDAQAVAELILEQVS